MLLSFTVSATVVRLLSDFCGGAPLLADSDFVSDALAVGDCIAVDGMVAASDDLAGTQHVFC